MKTFFTKGLLLAGVALSLPILCARADEAAPAVAQKALEKAPLTITDRQGRKHDFTVEIAKTEKEKEAGETLRASVPEGTGMLFLFTPPEPAAMWMRDTPASLDMVFIAPDGHIQAIAEKTVPFSERRLTGDGESAAVLEVAAGTMEKTGIVVGDVVSSKAPADGALTEMKIFLTGAAGFVGYHVAEQLLSQGHEVIGFDSLNDYYSVQLKRDRLARLASKPGFVFRQGDLSQRDDVGAILAEHPDITHIVHLAAQAGVRYSLADPCAYITANMTGHVVMLEAARHLTGLRHIVYASSSSVYGLNETMPFRESDAVDRPGSFYAVTKRAGELTAHAYAHLYGLRQTGLRFFTAYGPWGRPDMAYYKFARAISAGKPLTLYAGEGLARDFTYIDDIVSGVVAALVNEPEKGVSRVLNLGSDSPTAVSRLVALLEQELGCKAVIEAKRRPLSDVEATWSSHEEMTALTGWRPVVGLEEGVSRFVSWFRAYEPQANEVESVSDSDCSAG